MPYPYLQETSLFGQHTVKNHLIETKQEMLKFKIAQDLIKSCKWLILIICIIWITKKSKQSLTKTQER